MGQTTVEDSPPQSRTHSSESRLPLACDRCRRRKQKCDRGNPSCRRCLAARAQCTTMTVDLAASNGGRGYVEQLEEQLEALEQSVRQQRMLQQPVLPRSQPYTPPSSISDSQSIAYGDSTANSETTRSVADIDSPLAHLTLTALAVAGDIPNAYNFTLSQIVSTVSHCNGTMLTTTIDDASSFEDFFGDATCPNLSILISRITRSQALQLIDHYFESIHPLFPWSDYTSVVAMYSRVASRTTRTHQMMEELLTAAVLALGMDMCGRTHEADFFAHCISRDASLCFDTSQGELDGLRGTQGLLLLSILSLFHPGLGLTWQYIGLTISRAISFGFHREPATSDSIPLSQGKSPACRETFWSAYSLDRIICLALGKPFSIQDCDITTTFFGAAGTPTESHSTFTLSKILSGISRSKGSDTSHHYYQLRGWVDHVDLASNAVTPSYAMQFHEMLYIKGQLFLFQTNPAREHVGSATALEVLGACKRLIDIAHCWTLEKSTLCWIAGTFVFNAGIIHLDVAIRDRYAQSRQSPTDIAAIFNQCSSTLAAHAQRFSAIKEFYELYRILTCVASRYFEHGRMGKFQSQPVKEGFLGCNFISSPSLRKIVEELYQVLKDCQ